MSTINRALLAGPGSESRAVAPSGRKPGGEPHSRGGASPTRGGGQAADRDLAGREPGREAHRPEGPIPGSAPSSGDVLFM